MYKSMLLLAILGFFVFPTNGRGLDLSDPDQAEECAALAALTYGIAEQATTEGIPANRTEIYNSIKVDPGLGEAAGPLADTMARAVEHLVGRMSPRIILMWTRLGYCDGIEEQLLFGEAATKVGAACNAAPEGTEQQCIKNFMEAEFEKLPLEVQDRAIKDARQ